MGSWIIVATYLTTAAYLLYEAKNLNALQVASSFMTALILTFCGLIFSALVITSASALGITLENKLLLASLIIPGVIISALIRHVWNRQRA